MCVLIILMLQSSYYQVDGKKAIILGGTGLVGSLVLDRLLEDPEFDAVHLVVRRASRRRRSSKIHEIVVPDLRSMASHPSMLALAEEGSVDAAVVTLGVNEPFGWKLRKLYDVEVGITSAFAQFCRQSLNVPYIGVMTMEGTERVALTEEELETVVTWMNIFMLAPKVKGAVEEGVLRAGIPRVSFFRPANFETDEYRFGWMDFFLQWTCTLFNPFIPSGYHSVHVKDIARAMYEDATGEGNSGESVIRYDGIMRLSREAAKKAKTEL